MNLPGLRKLVLVGLALVGCDSFGVTGPPRGLEHAAITNSCGPADGPAVEIFLVPESM